MVKIDNSAQIKLIENLDWAARHYEFCENEPEDCDVCHAVQILYFEVDHMRDH